MNTSFSKLGRWITELLLVFIGVYAAFWLNNYQQHRQEAKRRDQILAALESDVTEAIANAHENAATEDRIAAEFRRALDAGEMPSVRPFNFTSDYSASDIAGMLQSGGYELLDVQTLTALRKMESKIRGGLDALKHLQSLSDVLIYPNLDQDASFFYDPVTGKLRKKFAEYPEALRETAGLFHDWEKAETVLLEQIRAERRRRNQLR